MPAQPACSHRRPAPLAPATLAVCVALACAHMGPAQAQTAGAPGATAALPEVVIALVLIYILGGGPVPAMIAIAGNRPIFITS